MFQYITIGYNFDNDFRGITGANTNLSKFESKGSDIQKVTLTPYFYPCQESHTTHIKRSSFVQLSEKVQQNVLCSPRAGAGNGKAT